MTRRSTDLEVARAIHYNESLRTPEPAELEHGEVLALFEEPNDMDISCILEPDGFFRAIDRNNYDVDCDHTGFFTTSPTGYGRTPLDAIVDLIDITEGRA